MLSHPSFSLDETSGFSDFFDLRRLPNFLCLNTPKSIEQSTDPDFPSHRFSTLPFGFSPLHIWRTILVDSRNTLGALLGWPSIQAQAFGLPPHNESFLADPFVRNIVSNVRGWHPIQAWAFRSPWPSRLGKGVYGIEQHADRSGSPGHDALLSTSSPGAGPVSVELEKAAFCHGEPRFHSHPFFFFFILPLSRLVRTQICGLYLCIFFADLRSGAVMHVFFTSFFEL